MSKRPATRTNTRQKKLTAQEANNLRKRPATKTNTRQKKLPAKTYDTKNKGNGALRVIVCTGTAQQIHLAQEK